MIGLLLYDLNVGVKAVLLSVDNAPVISVYDCPLLYSEPTTNIVEVPKVVTAVA